MDTVKKPLKLYNVLPKGEALIAGGEVVIGDFKARLGDIISCDLIPSRPEKVQVATITAAGNTLVADSSYYLDIVITGSRDFGWQPDKRRFKAVTSKTISDQAAEKALLFGKFVSQINDAVDLPVTASISGVDLVLTDQAGYYTYARGGASQINVYNNKEGVGFAQASLSITQPAVYSAGIGSDLVKKQIASDPLIGSFYNGEGQNKALENVETNSTYLTILFTSLVSGNGVGMESEHRKLIRYNQMILVKEGIAGFDALMQVATEAQANKLYNDAPSMILTGLKAAITSGANGGDAVVTTAVSNVVSAGASTFKSTNIGAQVSAANAQVKNVDGVGYNLASAETANIGRELNTGIDANEAGFVVGKNGGAITVRGNMVDVTDGTLLIGFRKKEAVNANVAAYTDVAAVGNLGGGETVDIVGRLNSAAAVTADSGLVIADGTDFEYSVILNPNGSVKAYVNGEEVAIESAAGVPLVFDEGDELVGFCSHVNVGGGTATPVVKQLVCAPADVNNARGGIILA